jgi:hypothetical protein
MHEQLQELRVFDQVKRLRNTPICSSILEMGKNSIVKMEIMFEIIFFNFFIAGKQIQTYD